MSKSALEDHSDEKKHPPEVKKMKTFFLPVNKAANKISSAVSSQTAQQSLDSFVYTFKTVSEIIWALTTVPSRHYLRSNEFVVDCFKKCFHIVKLPRTCQ